MKSHANGPLSGMVAAILLDAAARCAVDNASVERDLITISSRLKHEGDAFLTITLPQFSSNFERSLAEGQVTSELSHGHAKTQCLPSLLKGFTRLVFDVGTGRLLENPSIDAILSVRQICLAFKKVSLPCHPKRNEKAVWDFIKIEHSLEHSWPDSESLRIFEEVSRTLWVPTFHDIEDAMFCLMPKHGPGATCERKSGNQKYAHKVWYERLEQYFPMDLHLFSSAEHMMDPEEGIDSIDLIPGDQEEPVRVTLVPKTLKGPRIIAIEPVCMQYAQQALLQYLVKRIERGRFTAGHVNFTDQTVNQSLALSSSADGSLATLDLSAASDRVSLRLVQHMLQDVPVLRYALESCRSRRAQLPNGEVIHLKKFASMGSATCFPVESMYFLTVVLTALHMEHGRPVTEGSVREYASQVYVYGDDIIIPVAAAEAVMKALCTFGCKVNTNKSFWTGQFRESCGCDAYAGEVVTPTYIRTLPPSDRRNASAIISWIETSNSFYEKGFWLSANYMKNVVEQAIGKLPIVSEDSAALGLKSFQKAQTIHGWDLHRQCPYVRAHVVESVHESDPIDGYQAQLKCLLLLERSSDRNPLVPISLQEDHLLRSARHGASRIKRRRVLVS